MRTHGPVAAGLILVAALAGCGSSGHAPAAGPGAQPTAPAGRTSSAPAATQPVDVRTLVTLADATAVLGAGTSLMSSGCTPTNCNYITHGGLGGITIAETTSATMADFTTAAQGGTSFTGAGDAASYVIYPAQTAQVTFLHGGLLVAISVRVVNAKGAIVAPSADALEQLARTANGRI